MLETAQSYVARMVRPLLDAGYFDSIKIDRNRLYSQILDDLDEAAAVGFPHRRRGPVESRVAGRDGAGRVYDEAQECACASESTASRTTWLIFGSITSFLPATYGRCPPAAPI